MESSSLHIGKCIKEVVEKKGIRTIWLARQLHFHRNNIYKIYERPFIDTELLMSLSLLLDYDFFAELSHQFRTLNSQKRI